MKLTSNFGLSVGDIVNEHYSDEHKRRFEIVAVLKNEYLCEYVSDEPTQNRTFYWEFSEDLTNIGDYFI